MNILRKLATEWNKRFDEDARAAKRDLVRYIMTDKDVLARLVEEVVVVAVCDAIQQDIGNERRKRWNSIKPKIEKEEVWVPPQRGEETVPISALQTRYTNPEIVWLDYPLVNNKKLRHMKKGEFEEEAKKFGKIEGYGRERKEFCLEIAKRMPDYERDAGECLTEGIIRRIAEKRQNIYGKLPEPIGSGSTDSAAP